MKTLVWVCISEIINNIYMVYNYTPCVQVAPENPSGHAVHMFPSSMVQAAHAALQSVRGESE